MELTMITAIGHILIERNTIHFGDLLDILAVFTHVNSGLTNTAGVVACIMSTL